MDDGKGELAFSQIFTVALVGPVLSTHATRRLINYRTYSATHTLHPTLYYLQVPFKTLRHNLSSLSHTKYHINVGVCGWSAKVLVGKASGQGSAPGCERVFQFSPINIWADMSVPVPPTCAQHALRL